MKLILKMKKIELTCVNRLSHLAQGSVKIQDSKIEMIQKQFTSDIDIVLGNL